MGRSCFLLFYWQNNITTATSIYSLMGQKYSSSDYEDFLWKDLNDLVFCELQLGLKEPLNHRIWKKKSSIWSLAIIPSNTFPIIMRKNEVFLCPWIIAGLIYSHLQWVYVCLFKLAEAILEGCHSSLDVSSIMISPYCLYSWFLHVIWVSA